MAPRLVDSAKALAQKQGHELIYLDVSPDNTRAARFYIKQGFSFLDEWVRLENHPHIRVQTMVWTSGG